VLEWVFRRCEGTAEAAETPIGMVPAPSALNVEGLEISEEALAELVAVDPAEWKVELPAIHQHFARFGKHLPDELHEQLADLERRLG
jgi:phosphoenolpyruvate carboxykinase (GTP)